MQRCPSVQRLVRSRLELTFRTLLISNTFMKNLSSNRNTSRATQVPHPKKPQSIDRTLRNTPCPANQFVMLITVALIISPRVAHPFRLRIFLAISPRCIESSTPLMPPKREEGGFPRKTQGREPEFLSVIINDTPRNELLIFDPDDPGLGVLDENPGTRESASQASKMWRREGRL